MSFSIFFAVIYGQQSLFKHKQRNVTPNIEYQDNRVIGLHPKSFAAYNDCSIRRPNANKISEKKNWGADSKGVAQNMIELDSLQPGCILDSYRIASFLKRGDDVTSYGVDSPVIGYNYFHQKC